jgi:hydrogenase maturation protease
VRVIGCGNRDRGDDAVGLLVARRLRKRGADAQEHTGSPLELMELWSASDDVLLVDAIVTGAPAGTLHLWNARQPWPTDEAPTSSHGFDVAHAIELARGLDRLPARLRICGIEGRNFALGAPISQPVRLAARTVVRWLSEELPRTPPLRSARRRQARRAAGLQTTVPPQ